MGITLDQVRDKNNPINDSFNRILEDIREHISDESEVEKLLEERVVKDFVMHLRNNDIGRFNNEEESKKLAEVGHQRCLVKEENEDNEQENKESQNNNNHVALGFESVPVMPRNIRQHIQAMKGTNVKLIIEKQIYSTDLSANHNRFSMPFCQIKDHDFLTDEEKKKLHGNKKEGVDNIILIEPCMRESDDLCLKKWNMNSEVYVLTKKWNAVVERNKEILKKDVVVQLWSFRCKSKLCFALIRAGDHGEKENGSDGASTSSNGGMNTSARTSSPN